MEILKKMSLKVKQSKAMKEAWKIKKQYDIKLGLAIKIGWKVIQGQIKHVQAYVNYCIIIKAKMKKFKRNKTYGKILDTIKKCILKNKVTKDIVSCVRHRIRTSKDNIIRIVFDLNDLNIIRITNKHNGIYNIKDNMLFY